MCLGIPGRVVEIVAGYAGQLALVDVEGAQRRVNIGMLDEPPAAGDWVLLHMGFAVELIDRAKAQEALAGLEMMGRGRPRRVRRRFEVRGVVQGVGFRPFVYVTASRLALAGSVLNTGAGVVAEVEGDAEAVAEFGRLLRERPPPLAVVESVRESEQPLAGGTAFTIEDSHEGGRSRTLVSPDIATCADCLTELADPADRRYRHPFITCTHCGPRFTIVTGTPYDRAATTMAAFAMCDACRAEYEDPADRRFHAQPIACHSCGPRLELVRKDTEKRATDEDALRGARELLAEGRIVAVKGLGGYHLACDARNDAAVAELRRRKQRGGKPFAVMVADLDVAAGLVTATADERELLSGVRRPIVLLPRRAGGATRSGGEGSGTEGSGESGGEGRGRQGRGGGLSEAVAPGNPDLGLMLPYTPLHVLLFGIGDDLPGPDALVMTSANRSGEPIVTDDSRALAELAALADAWLRHDRRIQVPCDDSVSRFVAGAELPVRRSRGYAPLPLALPFDVPPTLAVGADLKNTCALAEDRYAWISQHIGDMGDLATVEALTGTEEHLEHLTGVRPGLLVADRHPDYGSGRWARDHAGERPLRTVQHHHAHIASVMGEHGVGAADQVIGVAFDGTGHGADGAAWGGEVLVAGYRSFRRAAHLGYVPLAGGDASVLRPYRMALAHLYAAGIGWDEAMPAVRACPVRERNVLAHQFVTGFGCVPTSSMGRLFDAVASLAGVRHEVDYEAEAAVALEGLARSAAASPDSAGGYRFGVDPAGGEAAAASDAAGPFAVADPAPVVRAVVSDVRAGVGAAVIAARFHAAVAALVGDLADLCRDRTGLEVVALGGGVFQNAVLLTQAQHTLTERGFTVLRPRLLPPNDGGIALGQLLIAAAG
ncbi:hydrogenase maturation protein HypF [Streptomyces sp. DvalAA-14]|uniref:HypC/HybG/HupF family hydrogenase formation chaperone n=1 Tax=unclassified Streptomyces TaxID=2593676 RepID=UPI00081BA396|nr:MULTISPECIES: HypC/HybG/HupF family hydrogenase formation chaperone [unclassified Streptomyces]MYS18701.1 HypC/HybG/HupF family hydrogenase formation chaperone [Streptomyces sp. SID4948]SCD27842.1 hydrogenase maturation protein HypF [Streptomyces sp. DvalAA-14]